METDDTNTHTPCILVVDDSATMRDIATANLTSCGFRVVTACDGWEGLSAFIDHAPAIVLMDVNMPEMDGLEACLAIRKLPEGRDTPIIIVTTQEDIESIDRAYEVGATDFASKPINWPILIKRIRYMLRTSQITAALQSSRETMRALIEAVPDTKIVINRDGSFIEYTDGQSEGAGALQGRFLFDALPPVAAVQFMDSIEMALSTDTLQTFEYAVQQPTGSLFFEARVVKTAADQALALVRDISERKSAERRSASYRDQLEKRVIEQTRHLVDARDAAVASEKAMAIFMANISHELRTPLHSILSFSNFGLKRVTTESKETLKDYFEEISASGQRLRELIDRVLDLSSLRSGKMTFHYEQTDLHLLIKKACAEFQAAWQARNISFDLQGCDGEWPVLVDAEKLSCVINSLLSNATKFSPDHSTISFSVNTLAEGDLIIKVKDQGIGFPENELDSVFHAFQQSSRTYDRSGGIGLGLTIAREIIERGHNGTIQAENITDGGACVWFTLRTRNLAQTSA